MFPCFTIERADPLMVRSGLSVWVWLSSTMRGSLDRSCIVAVPEGFALHPDLVPLTLYMLGLVWASLSCGNFGAFYKLKILLLHSHATLLTFFLKSQLLNFLKSDVKHFRPALQSQFGRHLHHMGGTVDCLYTLHS